MNETVEHKKLPWIMGIGASAGGLEALTQFVSHLHPNFPGAIVIAQHLAPKSKSMMTELLARQTHINISTATDRQKLKPGVVYIIPPNVDAEIQSDEIVLTEAGPETRPKPSVDTLFSSLARVYGNRAIGIILSGTGTDGSDGIRAIRAAGGVTIAQDAQSAKYDGMPTSAVQTGSIDSILDPEMIGENIGSIIENHFARMSTKFVEDDQLPQVLEILRSKGRDFTEYKPSTIRRRLAKRLATLGLKNTSDYIEVLKKTPGEVAALSQELLVSVTTFFRDPEVWEEMKRVMAIQYLSKEPGQDFRVWVAGCATGEEAYSLAMILADLESKHGLHINSKIFATDLDQEAILEGRNAVYDRAELKNVSDNFRTRFFSERANGQVEVAKSIREMVVFARQDLVQNPPFVKLDLVTCRNVLIYFEPSLQKRVIETFHYSLAPGGFMLLGKSEAPVGCSHLFSDSDRKVKLYEKLDVPSNHIPSMKMRTTDIGEGMPSVRVQEQKNAVPEKAYAKLIESYRLAGAIIDKDGNILNVLGDISSYVRMSAGVADFRITNLVPKAIGIEIPILIRKAATTFAPALSRPHQIGSGKAITKFKIAIRPLGDDEHDHKFRGLFVLTFQPYEARLQVAPSTVAESELPIRYSEIELELHQTREHLQTVIEELGVTNEELQSLNEELSSTNEELQASNEELETTNEELQSTNEELTTVNEELAVKSTELKRHNVELQNVYGSIGSPIVVVDEYLKVVRYNEDALKIFNLSAKMVNTDITRASAHCELPNFREKLQTTIRTGEVYESICEGNGVIYQLRIHPYYDENRKIIGAILVFYDNTSEIMTKRLLETTETRVTSIIDSSESLISLKDKLGRYILVNKSFANFFGYGIEQIIGKTDAELLSKKTSALFRESDLEVLLKGERMQRQEVIDGAKGKQFHFLVNRFPLINPGSPDPYAVGTIAVDITAQVEAQEAFRSSEARYRAIVEEQPVFVCRTRKDGTLLYVNAAFTQYFGHEYESTPDAKFFDIVSPEDAKQVRWAIESINTSNPVAQYDHRVLTDDGGVRWVRWVHRGIFNSAGQPTEYQAVGFDVTETKLQTDQLIEKEAVFKSLFSNTSDFISVFRVTGDDLVLEYLNRSAEKSYGYAYNQLIGRKLSDFVDARHANEIVARYKMAIETSTPQVVDEDVSVMGSNKQIQTTIVPIPGASGLIERVAAVSRDVSAYKAIELDLRNAKQTADVANRAKSDFLASMSHELRTPLNVVLGMAHLLAESRLNAEQSEYVSGISRSGQLLLSLIEDVLDISRIESGKIRLNSEPFRIGDIAKEISELFSAQTAEKGIHFTVKVDPDADLYVIGDPSRVRQIIVNLVGNAIKFTDHGKVSLNIKTEGHEVAGEQIFRFTVTDTGVGIKPEFHSKIFQKFSQAESGDSRRYGGSGLGLVISKHLANHMGGDVGFASTYGEGSTFWFTSRLILTTKAELENRRARLNIGKEAKREHRPLKVLAVDDSPDSLHVIEIFLKKLGHEATVVGSGIEAIAALSEKRFDIVLMDIQMPELDGLDTTRKIRSGSTRHSKIPIVALTANAMSGDSERCFEAGMNDYLTKPVQMKLLKDLLAPWGENILKDDVESSNTK